MRVTTPCPLATVTLMNPTNQCVSLKGIWRFVRKDAASGAVLSDRTYENLVPTVGRYAIASVLAFGSSSFPVPRLTYAAVGTGASAPANADTTLGTETFRKLLAGVTAASNVLTVDAFFNESEANGTLAEAGIFGDSVYAAATATANTGTIFSRVAISETKTSSETLTITWILTIS